MKPAKSLEARSEISEERLTFFLKLIALCREFDIDPRDQSF
jgi:hypothetical protein